MKSFNAETRAEIARGWSRSSSSQAEYAALHGISARTLRSWIERHASRQAPVDQVRAIIADAVRQLQELLLAIGPLDAEAACRPASTAMSRSGSPDAPAVTESMSGIERVEHFGDEVSMAARRARPSAESDRDGGGAGRSVESTVGDPEAASGSHLGFEDAELAPPSQNRVTLSEPGLAPATPNRTGDAPGGTLPPVPIAQPSPHWGYYWS